MREIKFRGWDGKGWRYGHYHYSVQYPESYKTHNIDYYCVDGESVGQYTGFKDKNGKESYEGDKIKVWVKPKDGYDHDGIIVWGEEGWMIEFVENFIHRSNLYLWAKAPDFEITGNIYQNGRI